MQLRHVSLPAIPTQRLSKPWAWGDPRLAHSTQWVRAQWAQSAEVSVTGVFSPRVCHQKGWQWRRSQQEGT